MSLRQCCDGGLPIIGGGSPNFNQFDNVGFYVWVNGAQVITATPVKPNWNSTVDERPVGVFDYVNNRFDCPHTGRYIFAGGCQLVMASGGAATIEIRINGVTQNTSTDTTSVANTVSVVHTLPVWLTKGDQVEYRLFQTSGVNATLSGTAYQTFFTGTSVFLEHL